MHGHIHQFALYLMKSVSHTDLYLSWPLSSSLEQDGNIGKENSELGAEWWEVYWNRSPSLRAVVYDSFRCVQSTACHTARFPGQL